jgi:undecaprenyl-phosphate galactose phosphotransferase
MLATALLVALTPTLCALVIVIRRDGGPALFRHRRIGADGRAFHCLKFRSMCINAEEMLKQHLAQNPDARQEWDKDFKLKNDPRVTRLGAFMRRTSLDELPQLLNVLKGDMSLVGPRPIVTAEVTRYGGAFASYLKCRPGITGLWQVSGRNDIDYGSRIELDARYVANWSVMNDVSILFRTFGVVMRRSGAY